MTATNTTEANGKGTSRKTPSSKGRKPEKTEEKEAAKVGEKGSKPETTNAAPASTPETAGDVSDDKKKTHRRSVYVCIPTEWEEVAVQDDDGELKSVRQATKYKITECAGGNGQKKSILAALSQSDIDPTNYGDVLMFRADPLSFEISQQTIIRI